jgi:predicted nucleic acid-binding Zn ribbon protein
MTFKSIHHVLDTLETRYQPREQQQFQRLLQRWAEVVGPVVAVQTRPLSIQRGVLRVATSSSAWAQNLVFERQRILEKLNSLLLLSLTDIRFSTAQWQSGSRAVTFPAAKHQAELWQNHPSRLSGQPGLPKKLAPESIDSKLAFQNWAQQVRSRSQNLPLCPHCNCPTPTGELDRWNVCSLCVTKRW